MAFTDDFSGTDAQDLSARTGWTKATDGGYVAQTDANGNDRMQVTAAGGGSGYTSYICTDQGSADHYTQITDATFTSRTDNFPAVVRLVDRDNFVGWRLSGAGASGSRMTKCVAGTLTDLVTTQGGTGDVIRIEATGTTYEFFIDSVSQGSDTVAIGEISSSETSQGVVVGTVTALAGEYDSFEAGAGAPYEITTSPASMTRGSTCQFVVSNPATTPTTGNTTVTENSGGTVTLTVDSITGTGPYTINCTVETSTALQHDATGYAWDVQVDAETDTSGSIPLNEPSGWDYTDLTDPVTDDEGSVLFGYAGDAPVTGDQVVFTTPTSPDNIAVTVAADGEWGLASTPSEDQTISVYVIQANGTIGTTGVFTFYAAGAPPASATVWGMRARRRRNMR